MKLPGLRFKQITVAAREKLNLPPAFFARVKLPANGRRMTTIEFEVAEPEVPTRLKVGQIKADQRLADSYFVKQRCSQCGHGRLRVTIRQLLPFPDDARTINVKSLLHLIVHLALPLIIGATDLPKVRERVDWKDKRTKRELVILFDAEIPPARLLRALNWAIRHLRPLINGGTIK